MRVGITGTRSGPDGARIDWPPVGGVLDCTAAEARDLIAGSMAWTESDAETDACRRAAEYAEWTASRQLRSWA